MEVGTKAGDAIGELLFGYETPSGKLTMSFPRVSWQVPIRYNFIKTGRPPNNSTYSSRYQDCEIGPLYKFGHGLSYANIEYSDFSLSSETITENNPVTISFYIENKSDFDCKETIILFFSDPVAGIVRPIKELVKFNKIFLLKNSKKQIKFKIFLDDLKYTNHNNEKLIEKGKVNFYVNTNENCILTIKVE
ncbi:MAG: fibronectin type III-like domain-contianing protein [Lachnospirales bacterium]